MSLDKLIKELEEAHAKSTPGPYHYDVGNGNIESHNEAYRRSPVVQRDQDRYDHHKQFGLAAELINPDLDMEYLTLAANSIPKLLEVIKVLRDTVEFYTRENFPWSNDSEFDNGSYAGDTLEEVDKIASEE